MKKRDDVPRRTAKKAKNLGNHVAFVIDASSSMKGLTRKVIEVTDLQVASLAENSKKYNQETRVSIWIFSDRGTTECVVWDMDVLRLPSIEEFYSPHGMTALIDATLESIEDLSTVSQIYGDHSFLMYVITDGQENTSLVRDPQTLANKIKGLPDNWTVAALVPDIQGVVMAKQFGFPAGNIQVWDATSEAGLEEASNVITHSHTSYMEARATTGLRSTTSLFDMSSAAVNQDTIKAAGLTPLDPSEYLLVPVVFPKPFMEGDDWISTFVTRMGHQYVAGRAFYQLTLEPVKVQVQKDIAIVERKGGRVYTGKNARALLGLSDTATVTLRAGQNPDYDIFIQSTSVNRKLLLGQRLLLLTPQVTYVRGQHQHQVPTPPVAVPQPKVAKMPPAPARAAAPVAAPVVRATSKKAKLDLTAPVWPKGGKATWAGVACPACRVSAGKRCLNNGVPMEKPHQQRKI